MRCSNENYFSCAHMMHQVTTKISESSLTRAESCAHLKGTVLFLSCIFRIALSHTRCYSIQVRKFSWRRGASKLLGNIVVRGAIVRTSAGFEPMRVTKNRFRRWRRDTSTSRLRIAQSWFVFGSSCQQFGVTRRLVFRASFPGDTMSGGPPVPAGRRRPVVSNSKSMRKTLPA